MSVKEAVNKVEEKVKDLTVGNKKEKKGGKANGKQSLYLDPEPEFINERNELFDKLLKEYQDDVAQKPRVPITVVLKDGSQKEATAWETSPMDIAKQIAKSFPDKQCISKVNGEPVSYTHLDVYKRQEHVQKSARTLFYLPRTRSRRTLA